jgi:signal transduction histidine kinase/ActR/RegA family two-component response regulator
MISIRDLPIRQKVTVILLLASGVALLFTVAAVAIYEGTSFRPEMEREAELRASSLSDSLHAPLNFGYVDDVERVLEELRDEEAILSACVYASDGSYFASYPAAGAAAGCPETLETLGQRFSGGVMDSAHRIVFEGELAGFLLLRYDLPPFLARMPQYLLMGGTVVLALLAVSVLLLIALERMISGPILELAAAARTVREREDFRVRLPERTGDEIGTLTDAFHRMLTALEHREAALRQANEEQQHLQEQLVQAQKMESIGRLAGGIAHDFNNLLTVIVGSTDLARAQLPEEDQLQPLLENVRQATTQASNLTNQLLAFARRQIIEPRIVDLNHLVADAEKMLRTLIGDDVELVAIPQPELWSVRADPHQMMQVLVNLAVNARDAMPRGGTLTLQTRNAVLSEGELRDQAELTPGEYVELEVRDTGVGLSEEAKAHLFEPFFTTKERGKGTGLGLAMCYGIVKQSGGHLTVSSRPGEGASFRIYLRRAGAAGSEEPAEPPNREALPVGEETVLVVEDNALVRTTAVELLRVRGYTVFEAANGPDALRLMADRERRIDLLVTDVVMPEMSGKELAVELQRRQPGLAVLYVSGYTADEIVHHGVLEDGIFFLQKPYTSETLVRKVHELLHVARAEGVREADELGERAAG